MAYTLLVEHNGVIYYPVIKEGVKITWERKGTPGQLTFTLVKDEIINFQEGDPVKFMEDDTAVFYGFVFKKKRTKDVIIDVTVYDQLRYLKNKDTYTEEGLKASDLLKRIITDFQLNAGTIEDTGFVLETIVEEDQTLFDIIQNALDETLLSTKQLYVMYDNVGQLTLQNINSMKVPLLIDSETAENFDYTSSIDDSTYNKIKLTYNNKDTGKREVYIAQNGDHINNWGVLQYFEKIDSETGATEKANNLLKLYDQKTRNLTVKNVLGDNRVKAGCAVMVSLNLGDIIANQFMVVEKVTHTYKENQHTMDLTLIGGEFIA